MTFLHLTFGRLQVRRVRQEQIAFPLSAFLVSVLVLVPLTFLILVSLSAAGELHFSLSAYTFGNYWAILSDPATYRVLKNTIVYASGSVVEALVIAFTLAWITERSDIPGASAIRTAMFVLLALPTLALTFGWIMLLNPGNGAINVFIRVFHDAERGPLDIYTMTMMILASGLMLAPTGHVMLCGLLRNMDPQLENAAQVAGSDRPTILRRVTLPLVAPGILSVGIYTTVLMVQVFDTPFLIGMSAGVPVLSTRIFALSAPQGAIPNYGLAAAFGVFLLALALVLMWGYFRAVRVGEMFRVVTGRGFQPRKVKLGRWRYLAIAFVGIYFAVMALPLLILFWLSLLRFYTAPSVRALAQASFANYASVFDMSMVKDAVGNTVIVALCTATAAMALASLVSWYAVRSPTRWTRALDAMAFAPMAIPPIVMAVAVLLAYLRTPLYGTIWIIVVAQVTVALPFGTRMMNGALIQVHKELEHAAATSGADWLTSLRTVLFPILLPHFLNGWLWVVAQSTRDLTIPYLLQSTDNVMISTALLQLWNNPDYPGASALAILMVLALMGVVIPVQIFASQRTSAL